MALAEPWHVRSRGRECAATQRAFTEGDPIFTALFPDPLSSGYLRRDYSTEGWNLFRETEEKPFSVWRTTFALPPANEATTVEKLSPEDLLRRLVEEDEDHTENARFIVAVMLERQKLLRETDHQRTPTGIIRVYEHRKTGEVFIVKDPDIPLDQVEEVQNEVFELLENHGRPPEVASAEEAPAAEPASDDPPAVTSDVPDPPPAEESQQ